MTAQVSVVVGNPKPQSRTLKIATTLIEHLLEPGSYELEIIDLAEYQGEVLAWPSETMARLNATVAQSDLVVFASPTYKATYTGLLKAFLDRYPANGLSGVVTIPVLTGADHTHSMGPTHNLAPLLTELGAIVPGRGMYFVTSQMDRLEEIADNAAAEYRANLARLANLATHVAQLEGAAS
ncbi:NADPH-dependent FMN reductase [Microbacterium sp. E-13]|uniref:NADPH-dependent FMN reductase n=1 Tax=Microbacterium sp. E-13 TaxID=3404048 RepID=UPI003CFB38FD